MAEDSNIPTATVIAKDGAASASAPSAIGGYTLGRIVGRGSCGRVYKAKSSQGQTVALKLSEVRYSDTGLGRHRSFVNEASALAGLDHPNILPVLDVGMEGAFSYIVSPLIESGWTLRDFGRNGRALADQDIIDIALPLAHAIQYLHDQAVIHRDIKPANILLDQQFRPMLFDFGISVALGQRQFGRLLGTPHYMAPEQINGEDVDQSTDQYAFAATLFELFTGHAPYGEIPREALFEKIKNAPTPDLSQWRPDLPEGLAEVLRRAMAKDRVQRFASMKAFANALSVLELEAKNSALIGFFARDRLGEFASGLELSPGHVRLTREPALVRVLGGTAKRGRQLLRVNSVFCHRDITPLNVTTTLRLQVVEWSHISVLSLRDQARLWQAMAEAVDADAR